MGDNAYPKVIRELVETKTIKDFAVNEESNTVYIYFTDGTRVEFIYEFESDENHNEYNSIRLLIFNKNNEITYDG